MVGWSSKNRDPAFGPRLTTSNAEPGARASMARWWASGENSSLSCPPVTWPADRMEVTSGPPGRPPGWCAPASGAPHWAQNRLSAEFSVPHEVQNTPGTPFLIEKPAAGTCLQSS